MRSHCQWPTESGTINAAGSRHSLASSCCGKNVRDADLSFRIRSAERATMNAEYGKAFNWMEMERIPNSTFNPGQPEIGEGLSRLKIPYLYRYWQRCWLKLKQPAKNSLEHNNEWDLENTLLAGLGLNILETARF